MKAALKNEGVEEGTRRREGCISPGVLISNAILIALLINTPGLYTMSAVRSLCCM